MAEGLFGASPTPSSSISLRTSPEGDALSRRMETAALQSAGSIDSGSTAWMLASSAMVLLMVPGLALFYGGMVRRKNVLTTMMMSFVAMAVIGVQWVLIGYSLAFGKTVGGFFGWDWD